MTPKSRITPLALTTALLAVQSLHAAEISIGNTRALGFGGFVAGAGGTAVVHADGGRSATGDVLLMPSSPGAPAEFIVTGDPNQIFSISLPLNGEAALSGAGGATMPLRDFSSAPEGLVQLDGNGNQHLSVGATLEIAPNQPLGDYTGSFNITVNYQ